MKEKLVKFIRQNNLNFSGSGSSLNGACTVICGYADNISANKKVVKAAIEEVLELPLSTDANKELTRVYKFASTYNYGKWWNNPVASRLYKF